MTRFLYISFIVFGLSFNSNAQQDKHFSMFYASKSQINPASAGFFEGDYQAFTNYRNQWGKSFTQPYSTFSAAFDTRFKTKKNSFVGLGFNVYKDVAGQSKFTVNQVAIPINYAIKINKSNYLSFGITPMFYQRNIKQRTFSWQNQWTGTSYNTSLYNGEDKINQNYNYGKVDLGAGLFFQSELTKYSWYSLGMATHHLISPNKNSIDISDGLYRRVSFTFSGHFGNRYSNLTFKPNALVTLQGSNSNLIFGSGFDYQIKQNSHYTGFYQKSSIEFGLYYRYKDALIINSIFHLTQFDIGISFDINISTLKQVTNNYGALEFFMAYRFLKPKGRGALRIH